MFDALSYPFFQRALAAGILASIVGGIVGSYVVVKRISSISGGLAHAAFGGVGLAYLAGLNPTLGGIVFGVASGIGIGVAHQKLRSSLDTLIAMVWAAGMALGIFFVSLTPGYAPDLLSYLFGNVLFVPAGYLVIVAVLNLVILVSVAFLFKEFQAVALDEEFAWVMGVPVRPIFLTLMVLTALTVVTMIRIVGVILVIALLTIPPSMAQHWTTNLKTMMLVAAITGSACTTAGLFGSYWLSSLFGVSVPTGPLIILIAVVLYTVSSLLKRRRGSTVRVTPA